jgi:hypothetical protein
MLSSKSVPSFTTNFQSLLKMGAYDNGQDQLSVQPLSSVKIPSKSFVNVPIPMIKLCGGVCCILRLTYSMQLKGLYGGPILMNIDELDTPNKILVPVHNNSDRDITVSDQEDLVNIEVMTVQH